MHDNYFVLLSLCLTFTYLVLGKKLLNITE